mgnify:CR=1 FL=1
MKSLGHKLALLTRPTVLRLRLEPRVVRLALVLLGAAVAGLAPRPLRAEELRVAPQLAKHKKAIKKLALVGDPRLSACVKAYERTRDPGDLVESIEMIAAGMDFNVAPMY